MLSIQFLTNNSFLSLQSSSARGASLIKHSARRPHSRNRSRFFYVTKKTRAKNTLKKKACSLLVDKKGNIWLCDFSAFSASFFYGAKGCYMWNSLKYNGGLLEAGIVPGNIKRRHSSKLAKHFRS